MDNVEYVYTVGMEEAEVARRLRETGHGVLALADGGDAYAVPLHYHYDGERLVIRMSDEPDSEKVARAETTEEATFVVYGVEGEDSWSVLVRGPLARLEEDLDDAALNERFAPFRLFDEAVGDVEMATYELRPTSVTGRRTVD
jgi:nitroimidazol reductase NimA-like FMN-containing flavoprotein (pyridoxamine 5'-phosphate oxidase superfamily)